MSKVLVAYFSASGVTKTLSERLADAIGADIYEIAPKEKYTKAGLNWMDKTSRSSVEMNDRLSRPAIGNKVENMEQYSHVFVGFPIWWYREPSIVSAKTRKSRTAKVSKNKPNEFKSFRKSFGPIPNAATPIDGSTK